MRWLRFQMEASGQGESEFWLLEMSIGTWELSGWLGGLHQWRRLLGADLLLSRFLSDSPTATPEWPGPLPHRLLLSGVFRVCHCHWDHTLQQVAGTEPKAFLLSPPAAHPYGCHQEVWEEQLLA